MRPRKSGKREKGGNRRWRESRSQEKRSKAERDGGRGATERQRNGKQMGNRRKLGDGTRLRLNVITPALCCLDLQVYNFY